MIDTIININGKLEKLNGRNLDDFNYLYSLDSTTLINDKFSCKNHLLNISFDEIRKYLDTI